MVQRLKTREQFQAVLAGERVAATAHFVLHRCGLDVQRPGIASEPGSASALLFGLPGVWLGAMVPKRWARRAVTRNAIKRQMYAVAITFEERLQCAAHVLRLRSSFDRKQFVSASSPALKLAVRQELEQLLARATATSAASAPRATPA